MKVRKLLGKEPEIDLHLNGLWSVEWFYKRWGVECAGYYSTEYNAIKAWNNMMERLEKNA